MGNPLAFRRSLQEACGVHCGRRCLSIGKVRMPSVLAEISRRSSAKYRKPACEENRERGAGSDQRFADQMDIEIVKGHVRPDHVHLLLDVPPRLAPSRVMQAIKGKTSHHHCKITASCARSFGDDIFGHEGTSWRRLGMSRWSESISKPKMLRPETTIFGSLSSQPASEARSLGDFSRMSNPPPSGGGEWDPSQAV